MIPFPKSPTGTTGMQKAFAIAIRKRFRDSLREIYSYLNTHKETLQESVALTEALTPASIAMIGGILEGLKIELSPIVKTYIGAAWWKGNETMSKLMNVGTWVPFNKRVIKSVQDESYSYLYSFIDDKQIELKDLLQTGITQGDSISTIANQIKDSFKVTAWKSELIARSETIRVYGASSRMAIKNGGVTKEYQWLTSEKENVCKLCRPLHGRIFPINSPASPMPVVDTHPQCNCGIIPYIRV